MLHVVIGGSASGKSEYAENLILSLSGDEKVDYIATMKCLDEETRERIDRHKLRRDGSRFVTIEQEKNLSELDRNSLHDFGMLECMSNLLANEMFSGNPTEYSDTTDDNEQTKSDDDLSCGSDEQAAESDIEKPGISSVLAEKLATDIYALAEHYKEFVVVTNDIFEDSIVYDEVTRGYIRELGELNRLLAEKAGSVTEVVCGIPLTIK